MVFGWNISPSLALILWVSLSGFLTFNFYVFYFQPPRFVKSDRGFLEDFESAWWNQRVVLWAVFIIEGVLNLAPLFATSVLSFFFKELQLPRGLSDLMRDRASTDPVLWFVQTFLDSTLFSFFILVFLLCTISRPDRRIWVANHFTFVLILVAAIFVVLQTFGIFLNNFIDGNSLKTN